jgi:hypothetical protein
MIIKNLISMVGIAGLFAVSITNLVHTHAQNEPQLIVTNNTNLSLQVIACEGNNVIDAGGLSFFYIDKQKTSFLPYAGQTFLSQKPVIKTLDLLFVPTFDYPNTYPLECNTQNYVAKTQAIFDSKSDVAVTLNGNVTNNGQPISKPGIVVLKDGNPIVDQNIPLISVSISGSSPLDTICLNDVVTPKILGPSMFVSDFEIPKEGNYIIKSFANGACQNVLTTLQAKKYYNYSLNVVGQSQPAEIINFIISNGSGFANSNPTKVNLMRVTMSGLGYSYYPLSSLCVNGVLIQEELGSGSGSFSLDSGLTNTQFRVAIPQQGSCVNISSFEKVTSFTPGTSYNVYTQTVSIGMTPTVQSSTSSLRFTPTYSGIYAGASLCVDRETVRELVPTSSFIELEPGDHTISITCGGEEVNLTVKPNNTYQALSVNKYNPAYSPSKASVVITKQGVAAPVVVVPELKKIATVMYQSHVTTTNSAVYDSVTNDTVSTVSTPVSSVKPAPETVKTIMVPETKTPSTPTPLLVSEGNEKTQNQDSNSSIFTPRNVAITILVASLISALIYFATRSNSAPKA